MNRPLKTSPAASGSLVGLLALGLALGSPPAGRNAHAQQPAQSPAAPAEGGQQIDKALETYKSYRERVGQSEEQVRKEIEKQAKEIGELADLKVKMTLALAECRAQAPGNGGAGTEDSVLRELKSVHSQLQAEILQCRTQLDQLAGQLHQSREASKKSHASKGDAPVAKDAPKDAAKEAPKDVAKDAPKPATGKPAPNSSLPPSADPG